MKTIFYLIVAIIFYATFTESYSQINPYTPRDGESAALDYASGDLGFAQPIIIAIGTSNQDFTIEIGQFPLVISSGMDMDNGESQAWVYVINDKGTDDIAYVGVANTILGYQAVDVSEEVEGSIPDVPKIEVVEGWIDTPELVANIKSNSNYQSYIAQNPESEPQFVTLYVNTDIPEIEMDETYWITSFGENQEFICFTNASNGETQCELITSVLPIVNITNTIAPNPAMNEVVLNKIKDRHNLISISLIDIYGNKVFETKDSQITNINLTNMSSGTYSLIYEYNYKIEIEKLIIKK